jgi:hypothetical protein
MRHSKATVAAGTARTSAHGVRRTLVVAAVLVIAMWAAYAFVQEAYIGHKLSTQVADLHRQNAALSAENNGYHSRASVPGDRRSFPDSCHAGRSAGPITPAAGWVCSPAV